MIVLTIKRNNVRRIGTFWLNNNSAFCTKGQFHLYYKKSVYIVLMSFCTDNSFSVWLSDCDHADSNLTWGALNFVILMFLKEKRTKET